MYQGHHPDGSSIQRHSAGSHYPFVIGKQEGLLNPWFVLCPDGRQLFFTRGVYAVEWAEQAAAMPAHEARARTDLQAPVLVPVVPA